MFKTLSLALLGALSIHATAAQAADTISFTSSTNSALNGTAGNSRTFTVNGLTVTATAWSLNGSTLQKAYLGQYTSGLGVTNVNEDGTSNTHVIDNYGLQDFVILVFNQAVNLQSMTLTPYAVNSSTDNDSWVSYGTLVGAFDATILNDLLKRDYNVPGAGSPYNITLPSSGQYGNIWLIGAANSIAGTTDANSDGFKLTSVRVQAAVPEPGTWALMLVGFGAVGFSVRRQRRVAVVPQLG